MPVITVAGLTGSGGKEIGWSMSQALGVEYVDKEIIAQAAQRIGAPVEELAQRDERPSTLRERIAMTLRSFLEKSAAAGSAADPFLGPTGVEILLSRSAEEEAKAPVTNVEELADARFLDITQSVIKDVAKTGNIVIVGRGSNIILRDWPNTLRFFFVAPLSLRIKRTMQTERLGWEQAERLVKETDHNRAVYIKRFFKVEWTDPNNYDLVINTGKLSYDAATEMAVDTVRMVERLK